MKSSPSIAELLPVGPRSPDPSAPVNVFIHGYRSLDSSSQVEAARRRIGSMGLPGRSLLLNWAGGGWRDAVQNAGATVAGLRAVYRVARCRKVFAPWMLLVDAGVVGLAEVAQFKSMERRAERLGRDLGPLLSGAAGGATVNLIGHSLGARVIHRLLAEGDLDGLTIGDAVLLGGAADLEADDWPRCLRRIDGRLFNAYSPRDRVLRITPDLRRRVGGSAMRPVVLDGADKVVNHCCRGVSHVEYWTRINQLLPRVWRP